MEERSICDEYESSEFCDLGIEDDESDLAEFFRKFSRGLPRSWPAGDCLRRRTLRGFAAGTASCVETVTVTGTVGAGRLLIPVGLLHACVS